jgi:hypothetical protein
MLRERPTTITYWIFLVLAALAVRFLVAFWLLGSWPQTDDAVFYAKTSREIAAGTWTTPNYWPVGRAITTAPLVWAFGPSDMTIQCGAIAIDLGCVLMAAVLAHQTLRRQATARLTGWLAAFYPPMIIIADRAFADSATMLFLLALAVLAIAAWRETGRAKRVAFWLGAGLALGMAILTRPATQSVLVLWTAACIAFLLVRRLRPNFFASVGMVSWKDFISAGTPFFIGVAACVIPIQHHNYTLKAGWVLSTNNEFNCLVGNNPYTPYYKTWHMSEGRGLNQPEFKAYLDRFSNPQTPRFEMVREAVRNILARPDLFALRTANRIRAFWGFDYSVAGSYLQYRTHNGQTPLSPAGKFGMFALFAAMGGGYVAVMLAAVAGLFLFRKADALDGRIAAFFMAMVLAVQFPYMLTHANACYHTSLLGFFFPFAAVALEQAFLGRNGLWPLLLRNKWFWCSVIVFLLIQVEYAYWVLAYH